VQFQDDLAAGIVLVRPALRSPGYVAGSAGWTVNLDGSAEFNNVTVRGTLQSSNFVTGVSGWQLLNSGHAEFNDVTIRGGTSLGGNAFYYSGTPANGNLVLSIAATAGTDTFGNAYLDGLTVYGTGGSIQTSTVDTVTNWASTTGSEISIGVGGGSATMTLMPPTVSGVTWQSAGVSAGTGSRLGTSTPVTSVSSPYNSGSPSSASISLFGSPKTSNGDVTNEIFMSTARVYITGDTVVNGVLSAANRVVGSVLITPSAANTPTSVTVNYTALTGTTFRGVASPETTVPGTQVLGVALTSITSTSALVWVTRTNTTATRVDYVIEGF
jgi:hypothetical protein